MRRGAVRVTLAAALLAAACAPIGGRERPSTVTVTGAGSVTAPPDQAEITTGVLTQAPTAAGALAANGQAMERLRRALEGLGIAARDIQTTSVSVSPRRRAARDGQPSEIVGYDVANEVRVRVRELPRLGRVLDQQVAEGANLVHGIQLGLQDPTSRLDEARRMAMADARRKAELYATAAGLRLGRVVALQEAGAVPPRPGPAPRVTMSAAVPIAPGELEIHASVTVTFTLEEP